MQRSIRFPDELAAKLAAAAAEQERSFSWMVVKACEHFVSPSVVMPPRENPGDAAFRRAGESPSLRRFREGAS